MTNVFVHYRTPDGQLRNREMFFSRAPVAGEVVYVDDDSYEVVQVDHHPGRNNDPKDSRTTASGGIAEDMEIWLVKKDDSKCPI